MNTYIGRSGPLDEAAKNKTGTKPASQQGLAPVVVPTTGNAYAVVVAQ
jgi:hypothetical protein